MADEKTFIKHPTLGSLLSPVYCRGIIKKLYTVEEDDTCDVELELAFGNNPPNKKTYTKVPIFYHCANGVKLRENGALWAAATAFIVGDVIIAHAVRDGNDYKDIKVIGLENQEKRLCRIDCVDAVDDLLGPEVSGCTFPGTRFTNDGISPEVVSPFEGASGNCSCNGATAVVVGWDPPNPGPPKPEYYSKSDNVNIAICPPVSAVPGRYKLKVGVTGSGSAEASSSYNPASESQGNNISGQATGGISRLYTTSFYGLSKYDGYHFDWTIFGRVHDAWFTEETVYTTIELCCNVVSPSFSMIVFRVGSAVYGEAGEYGSAAASSAFINFSLNVISLRPILIPTGSHYPWPIQAKDGPFFS